MCELLMSDYSQYIVFFDERKEDIQEKCVFEGKAV